jgi:hypothetical protein
MSNVERQMTKEGRMTKSENELAAADADPRDDDLIDRLLEHNPRFRWTLEKRLNEKSVSVEEARKRLSSS